MARMDFELNNTDNYNSMITDNDNDVTWIRVLYWTNFDIDGNGNNDNKIEIYKCIYMVQTKPNIYNSAFCSC